MSWWCVTHKVDGDSHFINIECVIESKEKVMPFYDLHGPVYFSGGNGFTAQRLLKKLNMEKLPVITETYGIQFVHEWVWGSGKVEFKQGVSDLMVGEDIIGQLTSSVSPKEGTLVTDVIYDGFSPYNSCTWREIQFIKECTGWIVE
jgi:hypothetical protein